MSNLHEYIQKMADEAQAKTKRTKGPEKRLTVILSDYDHRRLKYISKKLGEPASTFARNLIMQALNDAEQVLSLHEDEALPTGIDPNTGDEYYEFTEYGYYINGLTGADDDEDESEDIDNSTATRSKRKRLIE